MRIKEGFVLRDVAGQTMVIATGEASQNFHGMITLNATGRMIWEGVSAGKTVEEIAGQIAQAYDISKEVATADAAEMIEQMKKAGFLV